MLRSLVKSCPDHSFTVKLDCDSSFLPFSKSFLPSSASGPLYYRVNKVGKNLRIDVGHYTQVPSKSLFKRETVMKDTLSLLCFSDSKDIWMIDHDQRYIYDPTTSEHVFPSQGSHSVSVRLLNRSETTMSKTEMLVGSWSYRTTRVKTKVNLEISKQSDLRIMKTLQEVLKCSEQSKECLKTVDLQLRMIRDFPLSTTYLGELVKCLALLLDSKELKTIKSFLSLLDPNSFPETIEIPLGYSFNGRVEFTDFQFNFSCPHDHHFSLFTLPQDYLLQTDEAYNSVTIHKKSIKRQEPKYPEEEEKLAELIRNADNFEEEPCKIEVEGQISELPLGNLNSVSRLATEAEQFQLETQELGHCLSSLRPFPDLERCLLTNLSRNRDAL